jgi:hypothetical protein
MPVLDETLTWKGTWAVGVGYVIDDAVLDGGLVYVCNADNTSALVNRPPNASFWDLLVETPLAGSYASVALYRALVESSSDADDALITDDLKAMSRVIDKRLGRTFAKDASPVARIFAPALDRMRSRGGLSSLKSYDWAESENPWRASGMTRVLRVDDLVSVSSIAIDEGRDNTFSQTLTTNDYELTPRNNGALPEPEPYNHIELTEWGSVLAWIPGARVRITGIWGWPAVPEAIVRATVYKTAELRLETPRVTRTVDEFGQNAAMSPGSVGIVDELLRPYVKVGV